VGERDGRTRTITREDPAAGVEVAAEVNSTFTPSPPAGTSARAWKNAPPAREDDERRNMCKVVIHKG